jgi:predicted aldo/keto reductase-like oxidoreductase
MLYREFGTTGEKVSELGFGCMRFPQLDGKIDEEKSIEMIRYAIDNGVNYIDTAYIYHDGESESFVGRALQDGYREKVYLATKLPSWAMKSREDMDKYLNEQLEKLQTDHIDFYLVHALNEKYWDNLTSLGIFEFLDSIKKDGRVKHVGFSFHDKLDLFKKIVDSYHWSFAQIQYNYLDEYYQAGLEGLEYAANKNLGVVIMEPLRGGKLVNNLPNDIKDMLSSAPSKRTAAEWAFRFVLDKHEVSVVLSGMTTIEQVKENLKIASEAKPNTLSNEEKQFINELKNKFKQKIKVDCTECKYCMPCPVGVNIPNCFTHLNNDSMFDDRENIKKQYILSVGEKNKASKCIECGKCENDCPQQIKIREKLKEVVSIFEA